MLACVPFSAVYCQIVSVHSLVHPPPRFTPAVAAPSPPQKKHIRYLLHHRPATSALDDFTTGRFFNRVIDDGKSSDNTRHKSLNL